MIGTAIDQNKPKDQHLISAIAIFKECVKSVALMPVFAEDLVAGSIAFSRLLICRGAQS